MTPFQKLVLAHFHAHGRHDLPWRTNLDPYAILVSELMLQQTQVARVIPKFTHFLQLFPTVDSLVSASLGQVLIAWSGLGYNRRAKFLHQAAQQIIAHHAGQIPSTLPELTALPGIGINTAKAIRVYAFNQPEVFIETNIRSVFLHHFFPGEPNISDAQLLPLISAELDVSQPRIWYWALMDYGSFLKSQYPNPARRSRHYTKQSPFVGSHRQLRGQILNLLTQKPYSLTELNHQLSASPNLIKDLVKQLSSEGLVTVQNQLISLPQ